jgi:hypothetical protein
MLFQIYGSGSYWQLLGWVMVFVGLILVNEIARRTKLGGILTLVILPAALTVYFIAIYIGAASGADWALNNQTYIHMNSWFHYAKLYAATIGCIGFMMLKYKWSIGKTEWFKVYPFLIVAINILIAVGSDMESAIRGAIALKETGSSWWLSSEGVWLYGGWWNVVNAIAGVLNILCMTGWWGIYSSKKKDDMLWPDMTFAFIIAYDIWNFEYTYTCRHTHGTAVLHCFLLQLSQHCFGTRVAGFRTVPTHWHYGVCSHRYSHCFRTTAASPLSLVSMQTDIWIRTCTRHLQILPLRV